MNGKILIFARTPQLGSVKTRLQPVLGEEGCYKLHSELVEIVVRTAVQAEVAPVEVWHTGQIDHSLWQALKSDLAIGLVEQKGDDLGERLFNAASAYLSGAEPWDWIIIIGSDCPAVDADYLSKAVKALQSGEELVIGPAQDGGYVLLGFRRVHEFLFRNIPWGTGEVLEKTLTLAEKNQCPVHLLNPLRDIDVEEDLAFYRDQLLSINTAFL